MRGSPFLRSRTYWLTDWAAGVDHRPPRAWSWDSEGKKNSQVILLSSSWHFDLKKTLKATISVLSWRKVLGNCGWEQGVWSGPPPSSFPKLLPNKLRMGLLDTRSRARAPAPASPCPSLLQGYQALGLCGGLGPGPDNQIHHQFTFRRPSFPFSF